MAGRGTKMVMNFQGMRQIDVPHGRAGKHKAIVTKILSDLDQIEKGMALKVPLAQLTDSKEKVRAALNRASRKDARRVATASDEEFLYIGTNERQRRGSSGESLIASSRARGPS